MKIVVTGATGFLGSRIGELLEADGHEVVRIARPGGAERAGAPRPSGVDAGDRAARELLATAGAVFHFAGVPDPARSRSDPARAVRENAGDAEPPRGLPGARLRARLPFDGAGGPRPAAGPVRALQVAREETCLPRGPGTVVRLTSVFGPGQVGWEGARARSQPSLAGPSTASRS